jgi:hypothetical protein
MIQMLTEAFVGSMSLGFIASFLFILLFFVPLWKVFKRKSLYRYKGVGYSFLSLLSLLCVALLSLFSTVGHAQALKIFKPQYQVQQKGGIVFLANTSVTCGNCTGISSASVPPAGGHNGTNTSITSAYVDTDSDMSTFMSNSDSLALLNCSEITWAGLYWGGSTAAAANDFARRDSVKLKVGNGAYQAMKADTLWDATTPSFTTYHCFKNITNIVTTAGNNKRFTIANVATTTNANNKFGGWTIVVVYRNETQVMRNLTVFHGLTNVINSAPNNSVNTGIKGFKTPPNGPVTFELGMVVYDGDRGNAGDGLSFQGGAAGAFVAITDPINPVADVFNSTISKGGVLTPNRLPSFNNTIGYDADIFVPDNTAKNYIGNSIDTATIKQTTSGETFLTQVITAAIDVYEPDMKISNKAIDINGGTLVAGDTLEYTLNLKNLGSDTSKLTVFEDTLGFNINFVPGSMRIVAGPNIGFLTDGGGDDQGEYKAASRSVKINIGTGATATSGGRMLHIPVGVDSTVVKFRVTVTPDCNKLLCDNSVSNRAYLNGVGAISGMFMIGASNPDFLDASGCPVKGSTITVLNSGTCAPIVASSNSEVCAGDTLKFFAPTSTNATYAWSGPLGFTSTLQNPIIPISTVANTGTYTVTIAYAGSPACASIFPVNVVVNALPTPTIVKSNDLTCASPTATLTASPASGVTYAWSGGGTGQTKIVNAAGTYTVTVTDIAKGCKASANITVTSTGLPIVTISETDASCTANDDKILAGGSATLTASGGLTYLWSNGAATAVTNVTPSVSTTYTVTVTGAGGCTATLSKTITVSPVASITVSGSTTINIGASRTLTAVGGGTYLWNTGATSNAITVSPTTSTTYSVQVTSADGCFSSTSVAIGVNRYPIAKNDSTGTYKNTTLNNKVNYNDSDPDGNLNPNSYMVVTNPVHGTIIFSSNGTYSYTPTAGYVGTDSVKYQVCDNGIPALCSTGILFLTVVDPLCSSQLSLTPLLNISFGTGVRSNLGSVVPGATTDQLYTSAGGINDDYYAVANNGNEAGSWAASIPDHTSNGTDAAGRLMVINAAHNDTIEFFRLPLNGLCANNQYQFSAWISSIYVGGDNPNVSFDIRSATTDALLFSVGSGDITSSSWVQHGFTFNSGNNTDLVLVLRNNNPAGNNGNDVVLDDIQFTHCGPTVAATTITGSSVIACAGSNASLTGAVSVVYTAPQYQWQVSTDAGVNWNNIPSATSLIYTFTTSLANNNYKYRLLASESGNISVPTCRITSNEITLTVNPLPTASIVETDASCTANDNKIVSGASATLTASGGATYAWSDGATTAINTVTPSVLTTYTVTVSNAGGCTATASKTIDIVTPPVVNVTKTSDFTCIVSSVNLHANASTNSSYVWSGGGTTADKSVTVVGSYTVTVTDNVTGCPAIGNITVASNTTPPSASITKSNDITCVTTTATLQALPSTGVTYAWSNGVTTQSQVVSSGGNYTVTVTNIANGCAAIANANVSTTLALQATLTKSNDLSCNNLTSTLTVNSLETPLTFAWSGLSATTPSVSVSTAQLYVVTVTNTSTGCFLELTTTVMDTNPRITSVISTNPTLSNCPLLNDGTIVIQATGVDLRYSIDNGVTYQVSNTFLNVVGGSYVVKVKNNTSGCEVTFNINPLTLTAPICNEPPVVDNTPAVTDEDTPITICRTITDPNAGDMFTPSLTCSSVNGVLGAPYISGNTVCVKYTPNPNFHGADSVCIKVCDQGGLCTTVTVPITVNSVNDAPIASNVPVTTSENAILNSSVAGHATDVDNNLNPNSYTAVDAPKHGTIIINSNGTFTYTPTANFSGLDSVHYQVCDLGMPILCASATILITMDAVADTDNDGIADNIDIDDDNDGILDTDENTCSAATQILNNYAAIATPAGTPLNTTTQNTAIAGITIAHSTTGGTVPAANFAAYTYTSGSVNFDNTIEIAASGTPTTFKLSLNKPLLNFTLESYDVEEVTDIKAYYLGAVVSPISSVIGANIVINGTQYSSTTPGSEDNLANAVFLTYASPVDRIEFIKSDAGLYSLHQIKGGCAYIDTDNDGTPNSLDLDSDADGCSDAYEAGSTTNLTSNYAFTGAMGVNGLDNSKETAVDNGIINYPLNYNNALDNTKKTCFAPPIAVNDAASGNEETIITGTVASNDTDPNGNLNPNSFTTTDSPVHGIITMNPNGSFTYTPATNFNGIDSVHYQVCDLGSPTLCSTATLVITVSPVNDAPVATNATATTTEETSVSGDLKSFVSDVDDATPTLTFSQVGTTPNTEGVLTLNPNGTYTFVPATNFNGTVVITYQVCDPAGLCSSATLTITVTPVNDAPIAIDDAYNVAEEGTITLNPLALDTDIDGNTLTIVSIGGVTLTGVAQIIPVTNGTVSISATSVITFTPNANYNGVVTIPYVISDGTIMATANEIITVSPVNDAPIAIDDTYTVAEEGTITLNPLALDTDIDGNTLTVVSIGGVTLTGVAQTIPVTNGTVSISATGVISFTPNANYNGVVTIPYVISDGTTTATANQIITVSPVNDAPIAIDDTYTVAEEGTITLSPLALDTDIDGNTLTIVSIGGVTLTGVAQTIPVTNGTVNIDVAGVITFTPNANYNGVVTIPYVISDGTTTATANEIITVSPVNDAPVATAATATTTEETSVSGDLKPFVSDVDDATPTLTFSQVGTTPNTEGVLTLNPNGTYTFVPATNFNGTVVVTYQVCDAGPLCSTATLTITVSPVNDAPIAIDDAYTVAEEGTITLNPLALDTDIDGNTLTIVSIGGVTLTGVAQTIPVTNGTVSISATGVITFMPNANYNGVVTIPYVISDGTITATANEIITVTPVNDAPVATNTTITTTEETSVSGDLKPFVSDVDDATPTLVFSQVGTTPNTEGVLTLNPNGTYTFVPATNFNGTVVVTYQVCDPSGLCSSATLTITVTPVNDAPIAIDDAYTVAEEGTITLSPLALDTDIDGNTLTIVSIGGVTLTGVAQTIPVTNGTVNIDAAGVITFTPNANYNGVVTIPYVISDGTTTATANEIITVSPVNDAPVATNATATTTEETSVSGDLKPFVSDVDDATPTLTFSQVGTIPNTEGVLTLNPNGTYTFVPATNFNGTVVITYQVCDPAGLCSSATLTITVTPVNDAPIAIDDAYTVAEEGTITLSPLALDTDIDGNTLTIVSIGGVTLTGVAQTIPVTNGTVSISATGVITFMPNANYNYCYGE